MSDVYNSSYTGTQIDSAVGSVLNKESTWDGKQNKLTGQQGQVVGFDSTGNAVAQDNPGGGLPAGGTPGQMLYQGESGAEWGDKPVLQVTFTLGEGNSVTADKTVAEVIQAYQDGYAVFGKLPQADNGWDLILIPMYIHSNPQGITFNSIEPYKFFLITGALEENAWARDYGDFTAAAIDFSPGSTGLTATDVQDAIEEVNTKATRTAIPISIPTTGWADNKQTFAVTGIPSDPTTYEVHLSQVGVTNVSAAIACGLYIADEAENSLTLAVSSVPEAAFQVYAVVQGVSV